MECTITLRLVTCQTWWNPRRSRMNVRDWEDVPITRFFFKCSDVKSRSQVCSMTQDSGHIMLTLSQEVLDSTLFGINPSVTKFDDRIECWDREEMEWTRKISISDDGSKGGRLIDRNKEKEWIDEDGAQGYNSVGREWGRNRKLNMMTRASGNEDGFSYELSFHLKKSGSERKQGSEWVKESRSRERQEMSEGKEDLFSNCIIVTTARI